MGIFDTLNNLTPEQGQALLSFGSGLLQAAGPSLHPTSFGQAFANGAQNLTAAQQRILDQQKERAQLDMLTQQVAQATRKNNLINDFLAGALGGQGNQSAQAVPQATGEGQPNISAQMSPSALSMASNGGFGGVPSAAVAAELAFNNGGKLGEMINERSKPTDFTKQLMQAGIDPSSSLGNKFMQRKLERDVYTSPLNTRPGSIIRDPYDPSKILSFNPHIPDGGMPQFDSQGNVTGISPLPGAAEVTAAMTRATAGAKNSVEPMTAYDENGNPVFTNKTAAAGGGGFPSIPPAVQAQRNQDQLSILQAERQRTTNPADLAALDREIARVSGTTNPQSAFGGRLAPALAPGIAESRAALATTGAKRYNDTIALASDSPMRTNVYDNILSLSKEGVQTGPGAAWQNKIKGYAANTPLLGSVVKNWQNDVAGFQELNKFLYQNAQRNWQAAGGTGTDSQLEAFTKANPNDAMFPQALQKMAEWGKAGELALQGKANAMQNWKDQQGGNVANQDQFERMWRNNFDPTLFQLKTMAPDEAAAYVANLKKNNPNAYTTLMMKAQALKNIGGL